MTQIYIACLCFLVLGGALGLILAICGKLFAVKQDERIEKITEVLPSANCGGCGYAGCESYAKAIVENGEKCNKCAAGGDDAAKKIAVIMGTEAEKTVRYRAQVMCSGTCSVSKKKYVLEGASDCFTASRLSGGDKMCPNGCIGLGTCVSACSFHAISVVDGVAAVDYEKCRACGTCVAACPKGIIKLIPFESKYWVGCMSVDKGATTKSYCDAGCISCHICEKNCPSGAITVDNFVAHIDHGKCTNCGKCAEVCPRKIIRSFAESTSAEVSENEAKEASEEKGE